MKLQLANVGSCLELVSTPKSFDNNTYLIQKRLQISVVGISENIVLQISCVNIKASTLCHSAIMHSCQLSKSDADYQKTAKIKNVATMLVKISETGFLYFE